MAKATGGVRAAAAQTAGGTGEIARRKRSVTEMIDMMKDRYDYYREFGKVNNFQMIGDFEGRRFIVELRQTKGKKNIQGTIDMYLRDEQGGNRMLRRLFGNDVATARDTMIEELRIILDKAVSQRGFVIPGGK